MKELNNISVILVRPKYAENIGSVARVALNMGISNVCIIGASNFDMDTAKKTATHNAASILDNVCCFDHFTDVLENYSLLVGTSARLGRGRRTTSFPAQLAHKIKPNIKFGKVGLVFGPENMGLANDVLKHCGVLVTIPTADYSSINLAQSVGIVCYELRKGLLAEKGKGLELQLPSPASAQELASMYRKIESLLEVMDMKPGHGKAQTRLNCLHQLLGRSLVNAKEAKLIKDACYNLIEALENVKSTSQM